MTALHPVPTGHEIGHDRNPQCWIKRDVDSAEFPEPAYGASTRSPLGRWADVQVWLDSDVPPDDRGRILALTNATLLARRNLNNDAERHLVGTCRFGHHLAAEGRRFRQAAGLRRLGSTMQYVRSAHGCGPNTAGPTPTVGGAARVVVEPYQDFDVRPVVESVVGEV